MARASKNTPPETEYVAPEQEDDAPEPRVGETLDEVVDGEATEEPVDPTETPEHATSVAVATAIREDQLPVLAETQIEERRNLAPPTTVLPSPKEWEAAMTMATTIAGTEFVPKTLRNKPDAVLACILAGREIGIGPMRALREISILDGKAVFSASLMMSKLREGGIRILASESTNERAWIKAKRADTGEEAEVEWTYAEASTITYHKKGGELARLVDKDNWVNYPADMLWARCVGRLTRRLGPDLMGGMNYTAEEVQDFDDYEGSYSTSAPPKLGAPSPLGFSDVVIRADAPRGWAAVTEHLNQTDASVDWAAAIGIMVNTMYGGDYRAVNQLPEAERPYVGGRLANFAAIVRDLTLAKGDFPPVTKAEFGQAFTRAFDGLVLPDDFEVPAIPPRTLEQAAETPDAERYVPASATETRADEALNQEAMEAAARDRDPIPDDQTIAEAEALLDELPDMPPQDGEYS